MDSLGSFGRFLEVLGGSWRYLELLRVLKVLNVLQVLRVLQVLYWKILVLEVSQTLVFTRSFRLGMLCVLVFRKLVYKGNVMIFEQFITDIVPIGQFFGQVLQQGVFCV